MTYITNPTLDPKLYPPAGQEFFKNYKSTYGADPEPYAIYGYEAMSAVLEAIKAAGDKGNDRQAVIDGFFGIKDRESVLGTYAVRGDDHHGSSHFDHHDDRAVAHRVSGRTHRGDGNQHRHGRDHHCPADGDPDRPDHHGNACAGTGNADPRVHGADRHDAAAVREEIRRSERRR